MSDDRFVLAHEVLDSGHAHQTAYVLHGILGSRQNWRSLAKRFVAVRPDLRLVLVDLRCHGDSRGAPGPHTVAACARDLRALSDELGHLPRHLLGHSFGGKVVLEYVRAFADGLEQAWLLDSNPGVQEPAARGEVERVLETARELSPPFESRKAVVDAFRSRGFSSGLANWMTTNLERSDEGYAWRPNLPCIAELLADYVKTDLWPLLERARSFPEIHLMIAENSDRVTPQLRERALGLAPETNVHCHLIGNAGHWLHVDNPEEVVRVLAERL